MADFKVAFVGAGGINFGSTEGPWNHSDRLERYLGSSLHITAIIDPDSNRARTILSSKRANRKVASSYTKTDIFPSIQAFVDAIRKGKTPRPDATFVGLPPIAHGTVESGIETALANAGLNFFVDKPLSCHPLEQVKRCGEIVRKSNVIVSVGYMLRYLKAVEKMKDMIKKHNIKVMATNANYMSSYATIPKPFWWDASQCGGPIVEQGTHLCDLSLHFGGPFKPSSVRAHCIPCPPNPPDTKHIGHLSSVPSVIAESKLAPQNRIPRITTAIWQYESGAMGTFTHGLVLGGKDKPFQVALEVWGDQWWLRLEDIYEGGKLLFRRPGSDKVETVLFGDDDPYMNEVIPFVEAVKRKKAGSTGDVAKDSGILCTYEDGLRTYELTWKIKVQSEAEAAGKAKL
ncbi:hypothetical protein HDV00_000108 [Rhizophlyctis rosea]|nr:hypothetical protein HDV00_000108 [Rhizophlyctis rosea]